MKSFEGTLAYMAPELCVMLGGDEPRYDHTVDIFALGLCYLALLEASKGNTMRPWRGG